MYKEKIPEHMQILIKSQYANKTPLIAHGGRKEAKMNP